MASLTHSQTLSNPRRLYILPTGFGLVFAILVGGMLIGSLNYNSNLGFLLSFLLIGLALLAMLRTWRNLYGLTIAPERTEGVFAGRTARFPLRLEGRGRSGIELQTSDSARPVCTELDDPVQTMWLERSVAQRGILPLGRVKVSTRYPLGLFQAWAYVEPQSQVLVYPRPARRQRLGLPPEYRPSKLGDRGVGTDDFVGLRAYHPGESPGHIDWKALARERGLLSKQFGGDRSDQLWIDWDAWSMRPTEERLSHMCRDVLDASAAQVSYGLRLPGQEIPPARGVAHRRLCLGALARFGA
jgi:uncharacterized protein (DUF58 family)